MLNSMQHLELWFQEDIMNQKQYGSPIHHIIASIAMGEQLSETGLYQMH